LIQHLASGASRPIDLSENCAHAATRETIFPSWKRRGAVGRGDLKKTSGTARANDGNGSGKRIDGAPPPARTIELCGSRMKREAEQVQEKRQRRKEREPYPTAVRGQQHSRSNIAGSTVLLAIPPPG